MIIDGESAEERKLYNYLINYNNSYKNPNDRNPRLEPKDKKFKTTSIENAENKEQKTTVISDNKNILQFTKDIILNCHKTYDICCNKKDLIVMVENIPIKESLIKLKKMGGIKIRFLTEINHDNIKQIKWIIENITSEIRHLNGINGYFIVSDKKIYAATTIFGKYEYSSELVYSNVKGLVEQNQYVFDTLWKNAISADKRIMEIENKISSGQTKIASHNDEIIQHILKIIREAKTGLSNCSSINMLQLIYENDYLFRAYLDLIDKLQYSKTSDKVRWITNIENQYEQILLIKKFLSIGVKIRHIHNLPPIHFALSENQVQVTLEKIEEGKMFESMLYSTEPAYIGHFDSLFSELWKSGIDAEERIKQVEMGIVSETIQVIENSTQTKNLFIKLVNDAIEEIMIVFPSFNAVIRQSKVGIIDSLLKKANESVKVRILSPLDDKIRTLLTPSSISEKEFYPKNIFVREIVMHQNMKSTILMVDKKYLLAIDLKDDATEDFEQAIGLSTYSTSKPTILSNISIFDSLWTQTELFGNLRTANEKLEDHDRMQKEFINTAAHELRTPTQAISGYCEINDELFKELIDENNKIRTDHNVNNTIFLILKYHNLVMKNAMRLSDLVNDLLDVARFDSIGSKNFLHKEKIDLIKEINDNLINIQIPLRVTKDKDIKFKLNVLLPYKKDNKDNYIGNSRYMIYADRKRLYQILNNLISNAIKFSNIGDDIIVSVNEIKDKISHSRNVLVSISDKGRGISSKVMPKLFERFVTDSHHGTGLGLFIAKKLVEAHNGKIWAFNNKDGKGATFVFSLPLIDNNQNESDRFLLEWDIKNCQ